LARRSQTSKRTSRGRVEPEAAKVRASVERYFEAFEAGTLKAELCNQKVQDLHGRLEQLDAEKRELEAPRERLEFPAIDRDMLTALVDNFEQVIAEGPNVQKKDLLPRLAKKVLVHDRRTIEVWYGLPNLAGSKTGTRTSPDVTVFDAAPGGRSRRSFSGSRTYRSPTARVAATTANKRSRSPYGAQGGVRERQPGPPGVSGAARSGRQRGSAASSQRRPPKADRPA
jgi:hypothetical protein